MSNAWQRHHPNCTSVINRIRTISMRLHSDFSLLPCISYTSRFWRSRFWQVAQPPRLTPASWCHHILNWISELDSGRRPRLARTRLVQYRWHSYGCPYILKRGCIMHGGGDRHRARAKRSSRSAGYHHVYAGATAWYTVHYTWGASAPDVDAAERHGAMQGLLFVTGCMNWVDSFSFIQHA